MIPLTHCKNKTYAVVGIGKAGKAAIAALQAGGARIIAWDDNEATRTALAAQGATVTAPEDIDFAACEALVLSPGIAHTHPKPHPAAARAKEAGCEIIGDVELLFRECPEATYVGITGTNGKSTTTALIGHILQQARTSESKKVQVGGNLGVPALGLEKGGKDTIYVLEMSSYQMELLHQCHFNIAVWLNISVDHLDRHGGLAGYVLAKSRIFRHMTADDTAIIGWDDDYSRKVVQQKISTLKANVIGIGAAEAAMHSPHITYLNTHLQADETLGDVGFDLSASPSLQGAHNAQNASAAVAACLKLGVKPAEIQKALDSYTGLEHRMQQVGEKNGVLYINDSKATNADAAMRSVMAFSHIFWLCGGQAKEGDMLPMGRLQSHLERAYCFGASRKELEAQIEQALPCTVHADLAEAFAAASKDAEAFAAKTGTQPVVLLAPACASFDQWPNFEVRGEAFCAMVRKIN